MPLLAAALLWRRGGAPAPRMAPLAAGLAATCLLGGALALPDGIASQAGLLGAYAPWHGTVPERPANPHLLDVTHQVEPWLLFLRHELRAGRAPFWDPHQFAGEPFWSNGSSAPLFPLHLLFALLPVQLGLLLLPWLRVLIGGWGAAALARELGLDDRAAMVAAVVYPLSGMVVAFLLFPMGNTHALVPWVLWAVERIASGRGTWRALGWLGGLQLLGGHPETPVFTALLGAVYLLVRARPRLAPWLQVTGGWLAAGALSCASNLPLMLTAMRSSKWLHAEVASPIPWAVRGALLLRALLPHPFGSSSLGDATSGAGAVASAGAWWGPYNDPATAIYAGAVTLPLALAALPLVRRDRRWAAVLVMALFALLGAYHFPGFAQLLSSLPVVARGLHHYLKIGLELGLALLAAAGWQLWLEDRHRRALRLAALAALLLLALAVALLAPAWRLHGQLDAQLRWAAFAAACALALLALPAVPVARRPALAWLAPAVLLADLTLAQRGVNPAVHASWLYPRTPVVELLAHRDGRIAGTGATLRPDAAMVYGLDDVRGDSPVKVEDYQRLYATIAAPDPIYFEPIRRWQDPLLDELGVRWVVTAPGEPAAAPGWRLASDGADARLWERPSALPLVRWETAGGPPPRVRGRAPGRWLVDWTSATPRRLLVAETWDGGWSAHVGDTRLPVRRWRGALLAVDLPAGGGALTLAYRPAGLTAGALLSLAALLVLALAPRRAAAS